MSGHTLALRKPPIVEAVVDVDCDLPPGFDLGPLEEKARQRFRDGYPNFRKRFLHNLEVTAKAETLSKLTTSQAVQALQFLDDDERQLVQVRTHGFSFNRLAPYSSLDDYLPEIARTWRLYVETSRPVETRLVRLRYINRILLPMQASKVELDEYLKIGPTLADDETMELTGFLVQHTAIEKGSGHQISLTLTAQDAEDQKLPVIVDITAASPLRVRPDDWPAIGQTVGRLRILKNRVFQNTLTDKCLDLFQ